jgi:hypothetical protein
MAMMARKIPVIFQTGAFGGGVRFGRGEAISRRFRAARPSRGVEGPIVAFRERSENGPRDREVERGLIRWNVTFAS